MLILPYFGSLPAWFPYFAKSLEGSPILDAHLFTDAKFTGRRPANLIIHPFSLEQFNLLASAKLSSAVHITSPYKLCDFRPAYAAIFSDFLADYEYWAFGDLDLAYGNLGGFLGPLLAQYDVISNRQGWISGSLCVLRNCQTVNSLFRQTDAWKQVFSSPDNMLFDELGGFLYPEVMRGEDICNLKGQVESFTYIVKAAAREGTVRCFFNDLACEDIAWGETLKYEGGRITRQDKSEVMYVHYVVMRRRFFAVPRVSVAPDQFYIRKTGIYLSEPQIASICTREFSRVIVGALAGAGRLFRRWDVSLAGGEPH
jgi:hypothetical protein